MKWPESFHEVRGGNGCAMCEQGRPEETAPKPDWPSPFPEGEPEALDAGVVRSEVDALRNLCGT